MAIRRIKTLTSLLLLLAYLGQSLAVVGAPCAPPAEPGMAMAAMDHSGHDMSADDATHDCCDNGGFCSMSHCLAAAAVPVSLPPTALPLVHSQPLPAYSPLPANRLESLFRPPIAA